MLHTSNGACFADRWPNPRAVLVAVDGNLALLGEPDALVATDLQARMVGFVDTTPAFEPVLREAFRSLAVWQRIILELRDRAPVVHSGAASVRRLVASDAYQVWGLSPEMAWISDAWGGPAGLAAGGFAWGAFVGARLVAVACSFFVGLRYEDVGVVTEPMHSNQGLGTACAAALCADIQARGRQPSWSTSPDNYASLRVAEKLGFVVHRRDRLLVVGRPVPEPPDPSSR